jgi:hypothetical protein
MHKTSISFVVGSVMLAASFPCSAQSETGVEQSGGATSSGTVSSGSAASGGATSQPTPPVDAASGAVLPPGGAAGTAQAGSLSTDVFLGVGAGGVIVGILLVTLNHGNQTITTSAATTTN